MMKLIDKVAAVIEKAKSHNWLQDNLFKNNTKQITLFKGGTFESVPKFDFSTCTNFSYFFEECFNLKRIPPLDTSSGTSFIYMFRQCNALEEIPALDVSGASSLLYVFAYCYSLKALPPLNTSNCTNLSSTFRECKAIEEITLTDTSKVKLFSNTFYNCLALKKITLLDFSSATNLTNAFTGSLAIEDIEIAKESLSVAAAIPSPMLSDTAIQNIIEGLAPVSSLHKLSLSSDVIKRLTEEQLQFVSNKNWEVG